MKKIELSDFLAYKGISKIAFSPDGSCTALVVTSLDESSNSYQNDIWVYREGGLVQITESGVVGDYIWDCSDTLLYAGPINENGTIRPVGDSTVYYRHNILNAHKKVAFVLPVKAKSIRRIKEGLYLVTATCDANYPEYYRLSDEVRIELEQLKKADEDYEVMDEIPFWANKSGSSWSGFVNKQRNRLFLYRENEKELIPISEPLFDVIAFSVSGKMIVFAGESYETKQLKKHQFYRYDLDTGACHLIHSQQDYFVKSIETVGTQFLVIGSDQKRFGVEENYCFYALDPESGELLLVADPDIYIGNSLNCDCRYGGSRSFKASGEYLYFITTQRMTVELYRLSLDGTIEKVITKEGSVDDFDINGNIILLAGLYDMQPQELYRFSQKDGVMEQVTYLNAGALKDRFISKPQHLVFQNNNCSMDGWVLLPYGYDPSETYPGVLTIHGGPRTVYGPTFYHEMQALAGAGFFVFFCNPEGSSGCGNAFGDLRGKYGTIDYEDIMAFTDAVLETYPQIDSKRLAVIGGSYGGFMVNWVIGHTDRFAVAVSQRSISNWISQCGFSDQGPWFGFDQQKAESFADIDQLWDHSPLKYSDQVKTPTLFIHSDEDYRCGMVEGIQMFTALMRRGVTCRFCCFKGENHHLSRSGKPRHRARRLAEILSWLMLYTI